MLKVPSFQSVPEGRRFNPPPQEPMLIFARFSRPLQGPGGLTPGVRANRSRYNGGEMPFTVEDFQDLLRLLRERPEWRDQLRQVLLIDGLTEAIRDLAEEVRRLAQAQAQTERRLGELEQALVRLTEAQAQTEQQVRALAAAQAQTEVRLGRLEERTDRLEQALTRLTEAQARTEERVGRLEEAVTRLTEAQTRTEQRLEELAAAQAQTERQVRELAEAQRIINLRLGRLEDVLGLTIEEHAEDILRLVLREKGLEILEEPRSVPVDGEGQIDLAAVCRDPQGRRIVVVVESKARLSVSAVRRWADRIGSAEFRRKLEEAGLRGPYLAYVFGIRMDRAVEEAAREAGLGLLGSRGEVLPPSGVLP